MKETEVMVSESNSRGQREDQDTSREIAARAKSLSNQGSVASKIKKRKKGSKENPRKTKPEELYEIGIPNVSMAAKKDLELERKLAKRLKVKAGKLRGTDDGLNVLLDGMSSVIDFLGDGEVLTDESHAKRLKKSSLNKKAKENKLPESEPEEETIGRTLEPIETSNYDVASEESPAIAHSSKKHKKRKLSDPQQESNVVNETPNLTSKPVEPSGMEVVSEGFTAQMLEKKASGKYVAPHLRSRAGNEPEEYTQIRRRIRGKEE